MPLTREQKVVAVEEIREKLEGVPAVYLTDYIGLSVEESNALRRKFRDSGVEFKVVKNTLLRRALERLGGYDVLYEHLHGPTAVALSDEPAAPARVIKTFIEEHRSEKPALKVAFIDGSLYAGDQIDVLASLKSKDELIADVIGLLLSPATSIVGALQAPGQTIAGALQVIAEREA